MVDVSIQKRPHNAEGDEIQIKFPTVSTLETGNTDNEIVLIAQDGNNAIMPKMLDFMLKKLDEMLIQEGNIPSTNHNLWTINQFTSEEIHHFVGIKSYNKRYEKVYAFVQN